MRLISHRALVTVGSLEPRTSLQPVLASVPSSATFLSPRSGQGTLPPVAQLPRGCSAPLTAAPRPPSGSLSARPCSSGPKLQAPVFPTDFLSDFYQQLKVYQVHKEEGQVFFSFYNLSSSFAYFEVMVAGA